MSGPHQQRPGLAAEAGDCDLGLDKDTRGWSWRPEARGWPCQCQDTAAPQQPQLQQQHLSGRTLLVSTFPPKHDQNSKPYSCPSIRMDLDLDWLPCTFFHEGEVFESLFLDKLLIKALPWLFCPLWDWLEGRENKKVKAKWKRHILFYSWWFSFFFERTWNQASFETFISTILSAET